MQFGTMATHERDEQQTKEYARSTSEKKTKQRATQHHSSFFVVIFPGYFVGINQGDNKSKWL